jgi:hypothetical protein
MAGTPHGRHSCRINTGNADDNALDLFASIIACLDNIQTTYSYCTRVASYYGDGGATGFDYHDGANPCGMNAWALYEFPVSTARPNWTWYLLVQADTGYSYGGSGSGAPARVAGSTGDSGVCIGIQAATGFDNADAAENPWNGRAINDGADYKGSASGGGGQPVWTNSVGGRHYVLPRSNQTGGSYASLEQDQGPLSDETDTNSENACRLHIFVDEDCFAACLDHDDDGVYEGLVFVGPYTPLDGIDVDSPLVMYTDHDVGGSMYSWGSLVPDSYGGVVDSTAGFNRGTELMMEQRDTDVSINFQPNPQVTPTSHVEHSIPCYCFETPNRGMLGYIDAFLRTTCNAATNSTIDTGATPKDRVVIGGSTQAQSKWTLPWDGVTANPADPTATRAGVDW